MPRQPTNLPPYQIPVRGTALEHLLEPSEYVVGPGDRFVVSILGVEPYSEIVTVGPTGMIILPDVGFVSARNLTADKVIAQILARIKEVLPSYKASCTLYGIRAIRVSVTGAVKQPGLHPGSPLSRVTDLIESAGGLAAHAALNRVELIRVKQGTQYLDLFAFYNGGDMSQNPYLIQGDQIIVPFAELNRDLVLVRGLGVAPGYYAIRNDERLDAFVQRVVRDRVADLGTIVLGRSSSEQELKLKVIPAAQFSDIVLQPRDILYINRISDVSVVGEVRNPGRFAYQPGLTAQDYVILAGGASHEGSARKLEVIRSTGRSLRGRKTEIEAGDTIYVPRSFNSIFLGQLGVIQAALTFLNIYLAYLAARSV